MAGTLRVENVAPLLEVAWQDAISRSEKK